MNKTVFQAVDEFYNLVNAAPSTEAGDRLVRLAATYPVDVAIEALARLYVVAVAVNGSAKPKNVLHELFSFFLSCSGRFSMPTINVSRAAGMCL